MCGESWLTAKYFNSSPQFSRLGTPTHFACLPVCGCFIGSGFSFSVVCYTHVLCVCVFSCTPMYSIYVYVPEHIYTGHCSKVYEMHGPITIR